MRMLGLSEAVRTQIAASVVRLLEGLRIAEYSGASTKPIEVPAAWPQSCMLAHNCYNQKSTAAGVVVEAEEPDIMRDYMADESKSVDCRQAVVDTGFAAIGIGFEQNAEDCKEPGEEGATEGRLGKVGTDVDTLTMPDSCFQMYFGPASEGFGILDCSKTAPPVICWQAVLGPGVGHHSDISCRSGRRTRHRRHCQNLTVGVSQGPVADDLGLGILEVHIVLEAHGHTGADRCRGRTSRRLHELADNRID